MVAYSPAAGSSTANSATAATRMLCISCASSPLRDGLPQGCAKLPRFGVLACEPPAAGKCSGG